MAIYQVGSEYISSLEEHLSAYGFPFQKSVRTTRSKMKSLSTVLTPLGVSADPSQQWYSETDIVSLALDTQWTKAGPATLVGASASSAESSKPSSRPGKCLMEGPFQ